MEQVNTAEIDAWHEEARKVVDAYNVYKGQSDHNAASWPEDYGKLGLPPGGADFTVTMPNSGVRHGSLAPPPDIGGTDTAAAAATGAAGVQTGPGNYRAHPHSAT